MSKGERVMRENSSGVVGTVISVIVGFLLFVALLVGCSAYTPVNAGEIKLVTRFGGMTGQVFNEGLNWKTPFIEGTKTINVKVQSYEASENPDTSKANYTDYVVKAQTTDGQQIEINYTVLFRIPPDKAVSVYRTIGPEKLVVENVIKAHSRNLTRVLAQNYDAEALYSGTGIREYEAEVATELENSFGPTGVVLVNFLVRKISFDADYIQAIENQQIAQENIKTAKFNADAAEYKKQESIRQAEADQQKQKLNADVEAYSINVRGDALRNNPEVLQWEFVKQLGNIDWMILPDTGVTPLLPLGNLTPAK
jgi:regulator of protease activity HflC (stomatin/prohibitin superfamily)